MVIIECVWTVCYVIGEKYWLAKECIISCLFQQNVRGGNACTTTLEDRCRCSKASMPEIAELLGEILYGRVSEHSSAGGEESMGSKRGADQVCARRNILE